MCEKQNRRVSIEVKSAENKSTTYLQKWYVQQPEQASTDLSRIWRPPDRKGHNQCYLAQIFPPVNWVSNKMVIYQQKINKAVWKCPFFEQTQVSITLYVTITMHAQVNMYIR